MVTISSWIWTRVTVSISYDDNHYTMDIFKEPISIGYVLKKQLLL